MAIIPYRYTDGTIYIQGMQNTTTDKANILLARADWRADGVVPTKEFDDMFWFNYAELFGKECIEVEKYVCPDPYIYSVNYSPYYFITEKQFKMKSFHLLNSYNKNISKSTVYKILGKRKKLLTIRTTSRNFFKKYELYKYLDIDYKNDNILLLTDSRYTFSDLEALKYLTKNSKINIDINIYFLVSHISSKYMIDFQENPVFSPPFLVIIVFTLFTA